MVAMSNEEIGKRITEARTKAGLSGKELAEKIGVAASTITRYEKGTFAKIKLPVIEAIARELGLNPMWLLGKSEYMGIKMATDGVLRGLGIMRPPRTSRSCST